ncbi:MULTISPECIES: TonB-dependent receptor [Sphingomonadales]|uniref:Pesticin receptor n=2 Tax=Edaphosphingomonas TaxID=3423724 RepID=A0A1S1HDJ6_9SPHN|nr:MULTISPECIES: TonB-dependent receptor [Sphingomonas]AGH47823.1 TonB-dependent receptor [Sphingomonas sp. MM-1]OHT20187.1 Pesticin receptor precursor [Sphingomonas haloaromaticamans]
MNRFLLAATTALTAGFAIAPLHAQTAAADAQAATDASMGGIDDIVVTAQRRQESVQNVPIAISAFSGDQLRNQGVSNTLELGRFVPNLVSMNNTGIGSANAFYLRGLGNTETIPTFDPPVGTYVDDIYLSRQNANNINLFDVERVEVLRGPQGTLFGRNTTGGAVSVILKEPGKEFGGFAEVGYGRYNKRVARASVDVPLADSFAIKISGYWQNDDGYVKNVTTGQRLNDDDGWGVRLGVRGELSPSARWTSSYAHIVANGENILNFDCNPADPTDCKGRFATTGIPTGKSSTSSPFASLPISGRKKNFLMGNYTTTDLITSNLEFDVGKDLTLNLITGYVSQDQQYALDFYDGRSGPSLSNPVPPVMGYTRGGFAILTDGQHEQFSQEVKLNGSLADGLIDFVGGAFYLVENNRTDFADTFTLAPTTTLVLADRLLRNKTEALAGYMQADFNVTDQLKLTAGIRYTDETKTFSLHDNRASCNDGTVEATCMDTPNLIAPSGLLVPDKLKAKLWTPRFAVNYKATDDVLLFASATRGFKSGGWNARATATNAFLPFGPEKVWSYEAGIKSDWFDRRVRANLTFFYTDVTDLQTPSALVAANGSATFITRNFADMRNKGIEAEFVFVPVEKLNLYVNAGYQDAKYKIDRNAPDLDEYGIQSVNAQQQACLALLAAGNIPGGTGTTAACGAGIVTPDGKIAKPTRTPELTLAFGGNYELGLGNSGLTLVPSINASFRTKQETNAANYTIYSGEITGTNGTYPANPYEGDILTGSHAPSAWFINASLALNGVDKKWQLSVSCTNCFNETAANTSLVNTRYIDQPMTWMARARYNF